MINQESPISEVEEKKILLEIQLKKLENRYNMDESLKDKVEQAINCLRLSRNHIRKISGYVYSGDEEKKYHHELFLLSSWSSYVEQKILSNEISKEELSTIIELTIYLFVSEMVDEMGFMKKGAIFSAIEDHRVSNYGRERSVNLDGYTGFLRVSSHQFMTTSEVDKIFSIQDPERKISSIEEVEALSLKTGAEHGEKRQYYYTEPFHSSKDLFLFTRKMSEINKINKIDGDEDDSPHYFIQCQLQLDSNVSILVKLKKNGAILSHSNNTHSIDDMRIRITPLPAVDRWRTIISSDIGSHYYREEVDFDLIERYEDEAYFNNNLIRENREKRDRDVLQSSMEFTENQKDLSPEVFFDKLVSQQNKSDFEKWRRYIQKKQIVKLKTYDSATPLERERVVGQILRKHEESYKRLLKGEGEVEAQKVSFTRSGNSANLAAVLIAKKIFTQSGVGEIKVKKVDGWYFESDHPKSWKSVSSSDANVLLASIEPNGPEFGKTPEEYRNLLSQNIQDFLKQAAENPSEKFVMIIDKTSNIIDSDYFKKDQILENVTLIETFSVSKHQRGGRAHFYGAMAFWGREVSEETIQDSITESTGEITPNGVYALPRLRRSEVARNIRQNEQNALVFTEELEKAQAHLPRKYRWKLKVFSYYAFLLPSEYLLKRLFEKSDSRLKGLVNSEPTLNHINSFFQSDDIPKKYTESFEKGDSFGLDATRITRWGIPYGKTTGESTTKNNLSFLRFAFGRKTTAEEMRVFSSFIASRLVESTKIALKKRR